MQTKINVNYYFSINVVYKKKKKNDYTTNNTADKIKLCIRKIRILYASKNKYTKMADK